MNPKINSNVTQLNLEEASRAIVVCFAANVPVALWGDPGIGKSSAVKAIAKQLGYKLYDVRLSDKEPSDLGGIPYPHEREDGEKTVRWLVPEQLPFGQSDEKCILFLDEFDRADITLQNMALQLIHDRSLNGHSLKPGTLIVMAGNASTDIGTTPLSKAAANRMCHLYIEGGSQGALDSWIKWAQAENLPSEAIGFAQFRNELFGGSSDDKTKNQIEEMAYLTRRSYHMAVNIWQALPKMSFKTKDIELSLIGGLIGKAAATEALQSWKLAQEYDVKSILRDPQGYKLPDEPSVYYALTIAFGQFIEGVYSDNATLARDFAESAAIYGLRWQTEGQSYLMKVLADKCPSVVSTDAYLEWRQAKEEVLRTHPALA